jgi:hypothetical protein
MAHLLRLELPDGTHRDRWFDGRTLSESRRCAVDEHANFDGVDWRGAVGFVGRPVPCGDPVYLSDHDYQALWHKPRKQPKLPT